MMCPKGSISGPTVLVAAELVRPLGLLLSGIRQEYVTGVIYSYFPSSATLTARETRENYMGQNNPLETYHSQSNTVLNVCKSIGIYWTLSGVSLHFYARVSFNSLWSSDAIFVPWTFANVVLGNSLSILLVPIPYLK